MRAILKVMMAILFISNLSACANPKETELSQLLSDAKIKEKNGDYSSALNDLNKVVDLGQADSKVYLAKGVFLVRLERELAKSINNAGNSTNNDGYAKSAEQIQKEMENEKVCAQYHAKAIAELKKAIELDALNEKAYFALSLVYTSEKESDLSLKNLNSAINIDPRYEDALFLRALLKSVEASDPDETPYEERMKYAKEAIMDLNKLIENNSKNVAAYLSRSTCKYLLGDQLGGDNDKAYVIKITGIQLNSSNEEITRKIGDPTDISFYKSLRIIL